MDSKVKMVVTSRKDCTETIRKMFIKDTKLRSTEQKLIEGVEIRDHYRLVIQPYGQHLDDFDSLAELLSATCDILESKYSQSLTLNTILIRVSVQQSRPSTK